MVCIKYMINMNAYEYNDKPCLKVESASNSL